MSQSVITKDTLVPITAVIIVIGWAFSTGIMYNKIETLNVVAERQAEDIATIRRDGQEMNSKLDKLIGQLNPLVYADIVSD